MNFNNKLRYHLIEESKSVLDTVTLAVNKPECWQDLTLLYCYHVNHGQVFAAQQLLAGLFVGKKPITEMKSDVSALFPVAASIGKRRGVCLERR